METAANVRELLSSPQKIIITTHQRADGDAIGSSLGLFHYLKKKNQEVNFISPTDYPDFLKWMPGNENAIIFEKNSEKSRALVDQATLIFCLDFNKLYRLEDLGMLIEKSSATKILIDHHLEPDDFALYQFWDPGASSTSELVYDFILKMDDVPLMDSEIATCLYAGILMDTDRFRVPTTSPSVHRIIADLMGYGINHTGIYQELYETFSESRLRFFGYCIREKLEVIKDLRCGIIALEKEDLNRFNIQLGDTEGLVNYPLWIKDVVVSALITPKQKEVKLSLRSKGNFSVEKICREHFDGGGHRNASGGSSPLSVQETREKLISIFARSKNELQQC
ncbi:MAG TPA: bifunctional oligoribonuclease/PAP phosphatase NrnA [Chitinophagales bacterium]|nr:bifunctional oligoribonuclease/PAP phosphatase NrnA [Chitinophagales bacterium]